MAAIIVMLSLTFANETELFMSLKKRFFSIIKEAGNKQANKQTNKNNIGNVQIQESVEVIM